MKHQAELFPMMEAPDAISRFVQTAVAGKNISFAQTLAALRDSRELTIFEIAEKVRKTKRTVDYWLAGTVVPDVATRQQVIAVLSDPCDTPSAVTRKRVAASHHLIWDKQKGWEMRVTVEISKKVVGKRLRERLKTRNLAEAIARRDLIVANMKQLGLHIVDRRQKTQKPRTERK